MRIKNHTILRILLTGLLFLIANKNSAMDQPVVTSQDRLIFVKTTDNYVVPVEQWQIKQMNVLRVALQDQQNKSSFNPNNEQNPIPAPINFDDLTLVQNALTAASKDEFSSFFKYQQQESKTTNADQLINAANKIQANLLSALCDTEIIPKELQSQIIKPFIKNAVAFFKKQMIAHSAITGKKSIGTMLRVRNIACSNDNKTIAAIDSNENRVYLYDLLTGEKIRPIDTALKDPHNVSFSPDGKKIAIEGSSPIGHNTEIRDVSTGQLLHTIPSGPGYVTFSPTDNNMLIWYEGGGQCRLYDISNGTIIRNFTNLYQGTIAYVTFSPDGSMLLILGENDQHPNSLWNVSTGALIRNLATEEYNFASFSPNGKQIVISKIDRTCRLLNIADINNITIQNLSFLIPHPYTIGYTPQAQFAPHGNNILLHVQGRYQERFSNPKIIIWNLDTDTIDFHADFLNNTSFRKIMFSPDGRWVIAATNSDLYQDGLVAWSIFSEENEKTLELFEKLNIAQAKLVDYLCPSETPILEQRQGLYEKLLQSKIDFNIFKTLPKKIQRLFNEELFVPTNTPPRNRSTEECIGNECTIL